MQRADYLGILEAMDGLPVTVRLLDPPLHEFLPDIEELVVAQAKGELDAKGEQLLAAAALVAGGQPDARHARVPARHPEARSVPHAGARAHRSRGRAQAGAVAIRRSRS